MGKTKSAKKAAKAAAPKRPAVTHGGKRIEVPLLSGPVGPSHADLTAKYPTFNKPSDVELIEYYFSELADINFVASTNPELEKPGPGVTQAADAVRAWDKSLPDAIKAFQTKVGITDAEEKKYGIIRPDGPTLIQLVDYADYAEQLELLAEAKKDPTNYIYRGLFDMKVFVSEYQKEFSSDGHYNVSKETKVKEFLGFLTADPFMFDIRWMAYILATVYWETASPETWDTGKKDKKGQPIKRTAWLTQWSPVNEAGKGKTRAYGKAVKVKKLADGTAQVTEQDGDQWTINLKGVATPVKDPKKKGGPVMGVAAASTTVSETYTKDTGTELTYYGRGYAQLTWWSNYALVGAQIGKGLDLLFDPEKALDPQTSYAVLSYSVRTGKGFANNHKMGDYFYGNKTDYMKARAMVNGKDHAGDIAALAKKFEAILLKARLTKAP